jgi:hypothetical protein
MAPLSRESIFAVLAGLTALACNKAPVPTAEPLASAAPASPAAQPSPGSAAPAGSATLAGSATPTAAIQEVPSAAAKQAGEKEKSCAPGGCGAGQCGANKK